MSTNTNTNELHVVFGAGPVGKGIARELAAKGKQVRIVNRSGKAADLPASVEVCGTDAYNHENARRVTEGAAVIYQAAQPEYHEWVEKFPPLQTSILEAAAAARAKLVVVENLYSYGDTNGKPLTETLPANAHTRKGKLRSAMTDQLMAAHQAGKVQVTIGRASNFYGPEYDVMAEMVFYPALAGKKANALGSLDQPHSFTYVPDFAKALVILGEHDSALGQIWHIPNAPALTQREFLTLTFEAAGQPANIGSIGSLMMRIGGLFNPSAKETIEMMYEWTKPFVVDSSRFTRAFGLEATPIKEGIRHTIAWCRAHPQQKGR
ncbi:MAG: NAD-dependent epimerase/dehydratase family protein [bacterium]|nr:NAD-dependent epimerase/dehydratase family protein [bacterium]